MPRNSISKPAAAQIVSKTAATKLCAQWQALEEERLEHNRLAAAAGRAQGLIEKQLLPFVDAHGTPRKRLVELAKFVVKIIQKPNAFKAKEELERRIGAAEVEQLVQACGTRDKLVIESIG